MRIIGQISGPKNANGEWPVEFKEFNKTILFAESLLQSVCPNCGRDMRHVRDLLGPSIRDGRYEVWVHADSGCGGCTDGIDKGAGVIQAGEVRDHVDPPRYFMPPGETDPTKGHFGCMPVPKRFRNPEMRKPRIYRVPYSNAQWRPWTLDLAGRHIACSTWQEAVDLCMEGCRP
jgi:hypothetical protein